MKKNDEFVKLQQRISKNRKIFNDLFYLTKNQQQRDGFRYSNETIQCKDIKIN